MSKIPMPECPFKVLPLLQPRPGVNHFSMCEIKDICTSGLSQAPPEDRCLAWFALLGLFPSDPNEWGDVCQQMADDYDVRLAGYRMESYHEIKLFDEVPDTIASQETLKMIHADVMRSGKSIVYLPESDYHIVVGEEDALFPYTTHIRRIERVLYVFARMHPEFQYLQGFHDLVFPLYYVAVTALGLFHGNMKMAEATVSQAFHNLLMDSDMHKLFNTKNFDEVIQVQLHKFDKIMKRHVVDVYRTLNKLNVSTVMYAYTWFATLFTHVCELPVLLSIWDALFAHFGDIVNFTYYVGAALVASVAGEMDPENVGPTLTLLSGLHIDDAAELIRDANRMWHTHGPLVFGRKQRLSFDISFFKRS